MTSQDERRQFPRVRVGTRVHFAAVPTDTGTRAYLESVAADVSLGGMFLTTGHTYPPGTIIRLSFEAVAGLAEEEPVAATAVVRWRQRWRGPKGMGIQFLEFEGLGRRTLDRWLARLLGEPGATNPRDPAPT